MKRFYVFKDGTQRGSMSTKEEAIELIRQYQKRENTQSCGRSTVLLRVKKNLYPIFPNVNGRGKSRKWSVR